MATTFIYLRRILMAWGDYWAVVVENLRKARKRWARLSQILGRKGTDPRNSGNLYKAVVQATLLFSAETWVMCPSIWRNLGGFHHKVARRLAGIMPRRDTTGRWVYPFMDVAMTEVDLEEVDTYVLHH